MRPNPAPAWVGRNLNRYWDALVAVAPKRGGAAVMPEISKTGARGKATFEELGCGHYGCVIQSSEPGIVFKLTSDASEAAFVAAACKLGDFPEGVVKYYKIVEIPETYRGRRMFALWREEASAIGFPLRTMMYGEVTDPYIRNAWKELLKNLEAFKNNAAMVRKYAAGGDSKLRALLTAVRSEPPASWRAEDDPKHFRGVRRAMAALNECTSIAEIMEHTVESDQIGTALGHYIDEGILLADVHANNVGVVTRAPDENYDDWHGVNVITDPGHMVPLQKRWLAVPIAKL